MRTFMFVVQCAAGHICQARIEACRDSWYDDYTKRKERGDADMSESYRVVKLLKNHLYTKFDRR